MKNITFSFFVHFLLFDFRQQIAFALLKATTLRVDQPRQMLTNTRNASLSLSFFR